MKTTNNINKSNINDLWDFVSASSKTVFTNTADGIKIQINTFSKDKMPILIFGADNIAEEPIFLIIKANNNSTSTTVNGYKQLSGPSKTITRNGNTYHINASQYSNYWIITPSGSSITVANSSL